MTGVEDLLRLYIVHPHFGVLAFVMWHGQIVAIEFRNENAGFCAKASFDPPQQGVVIGVELLNNVEVAVSNTMASTWLESILMSRSFLEVFVSMTLIKQ